MQLYVKVLPVRAGTAEPVGEPLMQPCPSDVGPDTVLSFITGILGEPAGTAWTSSDRHPRFTIGWIFSGLPDIDTDEPVEFICMTYVQADDGSMQSLFELMADQRQEFGQLAGRHPARLPPSRTSGPDDRAPRHAWRPRLPTRSRANRT